MKNKQEIKLSKKYPSITQEEYDKLSYEDKFKWVTGDGSDL